MKTADRIQLATALMTALCTAQLHAAAAEHASAAPATQAAQQQWTAEGSAQTQSNAPYTSQSSQDVIALDGSGIISMPSIQRPRILIGGSASGGFDSNPLGVGSGTSTALYSFSPYIGMEIGTDRTQFLFQYHPTISQYTGYSGEFMQVASAKIAGNVSRRLNWDADVIGSHGNDTLRLLEPTQSVIAGGVTGPGPGSGSFLPNAGDVTDVEGGVDVSYDLSQRDYMSFHAGNSYSSFPGLKENGGVVTANFNYNHALRSTLSMVVYEQNSQYYGDLNCTAIGVGAGAKWQLNESTLISLRGGPEIDTPGCHSQQGFSYNASVARKLAHRSQFFITADRQPIISYLGTGLWQDDVSGGYERQIRASNTLSFNLAYVHSSTLVNISAYHATFFDSAYTRHLRKGLSLAWSYRVFAGNSDGTAINRNVLQFSLTLTPNARPLSR